MPTAHRLDHSLVHLPLALRAALFLLPFFALSLTRFENNRISRTSKLYSGLDRSVTKTPWVNVPLPLPGTVYGLPNRCIAMFCSFCPSAHPDFCLYTAPSSKALPEPTASGTGCSLFPAPSSVATLGYSHCPRAKREFLFIYINAARLPT